MLLDFSFVFLTRLSCFSTHLGDNILTKKIMFIFSDPLFPSLPLTFLLQDDGLHLVAADRWSLGGRDGSSKTA